MEILAYDDYGILKNGVIFIYQEPIEKFLKYQTILEEYEENISKVKDNSVNRITYNLAFQDAEIKIVNAVNKYFEENKEDIEKEIEKIVLNEDFMNCTTKNPRYHYFETHNKSLKLSLYPYVKSAIENIYALHKNEYKKK